MPQTYNDLYLETRRVLRGQGIEGYGLEARLLAAYASGKTPESFLRDLRLYASDAALDRLIELIKRRLRGEPVAYITGSWEFYGLPMIVTPDVLIPRVDTEVLAEAVIQELNNRPDARVLDLCSGSGCVGCAIAANALKARVVCVDNSAAALEISRENARLNGLEARVSFILADVTEPPPMLMGSFDVVACNPPYIRSGDIDRLDESVRAYEPRTALDGGSDGLYFYRAILKKWNAIFRKGAAVYFETGVGQAEDVRNLMRLNGFRSIGSVYDTIGVERVVYGVIN